MKKYFLFILVISHSFVYAQKGFALVELFTSEGDDMCKAAEENVSTAAALEQKAGNDVVILQYHVDYWNNRGWKDPYSKYQFTMRQENYSRVLAEKELYTPEVVINGTKSFSASKEITLKEELKNALASKSKNELEVTKDSIANDTLYLSYVVPKEDINSVFKVAITQSGLASTITAGQNANKSLVHNNVVRILYSFDGLKKGRQVKVPLNKFVLDKTCKTIGFVQRKQTMEVVAVKVVGE